MGGFGFCHLLAIEGMFLGLDKGSERGGVGVWFWAVAFKLIWMLGSPGVIVVVGTSAFPSEGTGDDAPLSISNHKVLST